MHTILAVGLSNKRFTTLLCYVDASDSLYFACFLFEILKVTFFEVVSLSTSFPWLTILY